MWIGQQVGLDVGVGVRSVLGHLQGEAGTPVAG